MREETKSAEEQGGFRAFGEAAQIIETLFLIGIDASFRADNRIGEKAGPSAYEAEHEDCGGRIIIRCCYGESDRHTGIKEEVQDYI